MRKLKLFEHMSLDGVIQVRGSGEHGHYPYGAWRELRSAVWPAHLRSLAGLLAEGAEQFYV
jgi:hypothetical protein